MSDAHQKEDVLSSRCRCGPDASGEDIDVNPDCPEHGSDAVADEWEAWLHRDRLVPGTNLREPVPAGAITAAAYAVEGMRLPGGISFVPAVNLRIARTVLEAAAPLILAAERAKREAGTPRLRAADESTTACRTDRHALCGGYQCPCSCHQETGDAAAGDHR